MANSRASTSALKKYMQKYLSVDEFGECITDENAHVALKEVFSEFESIYCGIEAEKTGLRVFSVKSAKTRKVFLKVRVIKES